MRESADHDHPAASDFERSFDFYGDRLFVAGLLINGVAAEKQIAAVLMRMPDRPRAQGLVAALLAEGVVPLSARDAFGDVFRSQLPSNPEEQLAKCAAMYARLLARVLEQVQLALVRDYLQADITTPSPAAEPESQSTQTTLTVEAINAPSPEPSPSNRPVQTASPKSPPAAGPLPLVDRGNEQFHLLQQHAKGGLGEIWRGWDDHLHRDVAIKMMQPQVEATSQGTTRFLREVRINAQLQHPSIVPVYNLGSDVHSGRIFYTMRFLEGGNLDDQIAHLHSMPVGPERTAELRRLLDAFKRIAQAVGYAHSQSIIHRDLKPANIIVGDFGEAFLLDWGLAKKMDEEEASFSAMDSTSSLHLTAAGAILGSPRYMSPEQARGEECDFRTDIYGLGAILFKLLTGKAPHTGEKSKDLQQLCQQIGTQRSPRTVDVDRHVPPSLDALCAKAMEFRPKNRYQCVDDLLADLDNLLAGEPISVLPEGRYQKMARWAVRHRLFTLGATAVVLGLVLTISVIASQSWAYTTVQRETTKLTTLDDLFSSLYSMQIAAAEPVRDTLFLADLPQINLLTDSTREGNKGAAEEARTHLTRSIRNILLDDPQMLSVAIWNKEHELLLALHRPYPFAEEVRMGLGDRSFLPGDFFEQASQRREGEVAVTPIHLFQWSIKDSDYDGLEVACLSPVAPAEPTKGDQPQAFVEMTHFLDPFLQNNPLSEEQRSTNIYDWPTDLYLATSQGEIIRSLSGESMRQQSMTKPLPLVEKFPFLQSLVNGPADVTMIPYQTGVGNPPMSVAAVKLTIPEWKPAQSVILVAATESTKQDLQMGSMRRLVYLAGLAILAGSIVGLALLWRALQRSVQQL